MTLACAAGHAEGWWGPGDHEAGVVSSGLGLGSIRLGGARLHVEGNGSRDPTNPPRDRQRARVSGNVDIRRPGRQEGMGWISG